MDERAKYTWVNPDDGNEYKVWKRTTSKQTHVWCVGHLERMAAAQTMDAWREFLPNNWDVITLLDKDR